MNFWYIHNDGHLKIGHQHYNHSCSLHSLFLVRLNATNATLTIPIANHVTSNEVWGATDDDDKLGCPWVKIHHEIQGDVRYTW